MFESEQKDHPSILGWILSGGYLLVATVLAVCNLLIYLFPGDSREEIRLRGINGLGGLLLMASMLVTAPLVPYLLWKFFVRRTLPKFWTIVFLLASSPLWIMFLFGIVFRSVR